MTEKTTLAECYVAFLDLMGVRNLVKAAARDATLCNKVVTALQETKNLSSFYRVRKDVDTGQVTKWTLQVQAFSDCVVLFIPTESTMLSWLLASIRRLHDRLIRLNVPIRGGITIGEMHWDHAWEIDPAVSGIDSTDHSFASSTPIAFGPGLVAAFDLESATAVYPRILISEALYCHVEKLKQQLGDKAFPLADSRRLADFIRQDFDGLWHFDLLHADLNRRDVVRQIEELDEDGKHVLRNEFDNTTYGEWLEVVRQFIEAGNAAVSGEKLAAKYMWLANYYNEKAKCQDSKLIRWFVPDGTFKLTVKQKCNNK